MEKQPTETGSPPAHRIQHTEPVIAPGHAAPHQAPAPAPALGEQDLAPLPVVEALGPRGRTITAFGDVRRHEEVWKRSPNTTGQGAIHVRTFHTKLTDEAIKYMDQTINEWLDAHPQYEVKFVQSSVGILTGKLKEPHLICQVWV